MTLHQVQEPAVIDRPNFFRRSALIFGRLLDVVRRRIKGPDEYLRTVRTGDDAVGDRMEFYLRPR